MKTYILLLLQLFLVAFNLWCQEKPNHQKKIYISPDQKIFFNKSLPVYFWVSSSPSDESPKYRLPSEETPQYTNPMYLDTDGRNTFRSPFAVDTVTKKVVSPQIELQYQVYADGNAPVSKIKTEMGHFVQTSSKIYTTGKIKVSFSVIDDFSGVEATMVSIDKAPFSKFSDTLIIEQERIHTLKYYSVDNTGNAEEIKNYEFCIDNTPPVTQFKINGTEYNQIIPGNSFLELSATDSFSGIKTIFYSIDSNKFIPYVSKIQTSTLGQGSHQIRFFSEDKLGNKETSKEYSFFVDITPPQVIEEILGKTYVANGREFSAGTSKLKLSAFDNKSGVKEIYYSINQAPFELYEKPVVLSGFKGNMLIRSYAVDNVGNKSASDITGSRKNNLAYIDLGAPWVGYSFVGANLLTRDTLFINHKTLIKLSARDTESGIQKIEYQIDSSEIMLYSKDISIETEGFHRIAIFGYDNTDNLTRQTFEVLVDTAGPEIYERFSSVSLGSLTIDSISIPVYPTNVVLFLSATDQKSGYDNLMYSVNNETFKPYIRDIRNFASGRKNVLKVLATDKLGNRSTKNIEFYIK